MVYASVVRICRLNVRLIFMLALVIGVTACSKGNNEETTDDSGQGPDGATISKSEVPPPDGHINSPSRDVAIKVGGQVNFSASATGAGNPIKFIWNFDGGAVNSNQQTPGVVTFDQVGTFEVTLTVTDTITSKIDATPAKRIITVTGNGTPLETANLDPIVVTKSTAPDGIIASPSSTQTIRMGQSLFFDARMVDLESKAPYQYSWHFDAAATVSTNQQRTPGTIQFDKAGTYEISLVVTDSDGLVDPTPATRIIIVETNNPSNDVTPNGTILSPATDINIREGESVSFSSMGSGSSNIPLVYIWNFDGGAVNSNKQNPSNIVFNSPGVYNVTLRIKDSQGNFDETPDQRKVIVTAKAGSNQSPIGVITKPTNNVTINAGQSVVFQATASDAEQNTPYTFQWDFGNGATNITTKNTSTGNVLFAKEGSFRVRLTVVDNAGVADATPVERIVTVIDPTKNNAAPNSFISSPTQDRVIGIGEHLVFASLGADPNNRTPLKYIWNFDGAVPNVEQQSPGAVIFNEPGTYRVTLTVQNSIGIIDATPAERIITVTANPSNSTNQAPKAEILSPIGKITIRAGNTVFFSGAGLDPDGHIPLSYHWDFDGGATNDTRKRPGDILFNTAGTYTVRLTVKDSLNKANEIIVERVVTVVASANSNQMPVAQIANPTDNRSIAVGDVINFIGSASDPDNNIPLSYFWDFDGAVSNVNTRDPGNVAFRQPGVYRIKLVVTDSLGLAGEPVIRIITVGNGNNNGDNTPPDGVIDSPQGDQVIELGQSLIFGASATDSDNDVPLTYVWNFDGAIPNKPMKDPGEVTFTQIGTYLIRLIVSDSQGMRDLNPPSIKVTVRNTANNNHAPNGVILTPSTDVTINKGGVVAFRGAGFDPEKDADMSYTWDFGGGAQNANSINPGNVTFNIPGVYRVRLTVTDSLGLADPTPMERIITVRADSTNAIVPNGQITFPATNIDIIVGAQVNFTGLATNDISNDLSYLWNFDGATLNSTVQNPSVIFDTAGTYRISLTVIDKQTGLLDPTPAFRRVIVRTSAQSQPNQDNQAPAGVILTPIDNLVINVGGAVMFSASASDPDGDTQMAYRWNFNGAAPNMISATPGRVVFDKVGVYRISLTVTDSTGLSDPTPVFRTIAVRSNGITTNFNPIGNILSPGEDVTIQRGGSVFFTAMADDPDGNLPLKYHWVFDEIIRIAPDSFEQNPGNITFNDTGTYLVTLTVTDSLGLDSVADIRLVNVIENTVSNAAPIGRISSPFTEDITIFAGNSVYFEATGEDPDHSLPLIYSWSFIGDAVPNFTITPNFNVQKLGSIMFDQPGEYRVQLQVADSRGLLATDVDKRKIIVIGKEEGAISLNLEPNGTILAPASNEVINVGDSIYFSGIGTDPKGDTAFRYFWNFDGAALNAALAGPGQVRFNKKGTFYISFLVADSEGLSDPTPAVVIVTVR